MALDAFSTPDAAHQPAHNLYGAGDAGDLNPAVILGQAHAVLAFMAANLEENGNMATPHVTLGVIDAATTLLGLGIRLQYPDEVEGAHTLRSVH